MCLLGAAVEGAAVRYGGQGAGCLPEGNTPPAVRRNGCGDRLGRARQQVVFSEPLPNPAFCEPRLGCWALPSRVLQKHPPFPGVHLVGGDTGRSDRIDPTVDDDYPLGDDPFRVGYVGGVSSCRSVR